MSDVITSTTDLYLFVDSALADQPSFDLAADRDLQQQCMMRVWERLEADDQSDVRTLMQVVLRAAEAVQEGERAYLTHRVLWHDLPGVDHLLR